MTVTIDCGTVEVVTPGVPEQTVTPPDGSVIAFDTPNVYLAGGTIHVHQQVSASAFWSLPNPHGRLCNVTVYLSGEQVEADVTVTPSLITVMFPSPVTGALAAS